MTITLLDTVTFGTGSASINITGLSTGGISGAPGRYVCTDTRSTAASIIEGRDISRAIPLYQANINEFNTYANTTAGLTRHYKLTEDVILLPVAVGESNWTAIETYLPAARFSGSFDGQNHTISNLTIYAPGSDCQGMFGCISGIVKNIGLTGGSINGDSFVGGVVGMNLCMVENCYSTGDVSGTGNIGGVEGYNDGTVENCVALNPVVTITSGANIDFGRVVGLFNVGFLGTGNHAHSNMKFIDGSTSMPFTPSTPVISDLTGVTWP